MTLWPFEVKKKSNFSVIFNSMSVTSYTSAPLWKTPNTMVSAERAYPGE